MSPLGKTLEELHREHPWLWSPEFGLCAVGSAALAESCQREGVEGPDPLDLDLAWAPDPVAGRAILQEHGIFRATTDANVARGTLAIAWSGRRIEVTSYRGHADGSSDGPLLADLGERDMTIGAVAWRLADDRIFDPHGGLEHWRARRIVPVGDAGVRIGEHPVRHVRYYRKAHSLEFAIEGSIRKVAADAEQLASIPAEALASEFRRALLDCRSPGRFFMELFEAGILGILTPELALQFDGIPAGPIRHHPEVGQALHLILVLEWAAQATTALSERNHLAVLVAALCHDLGKGTTDSRRWPAHHGHERDGIPVLRRLLARLPGLTDPRSRRLCELVCMLHLDARRLRSMRAGTLVDLHDRHFRAKDFPVDLFALALGADCGGRLGREDEGHAVVAQVAADIRWLRSCCASVDAHALRAQHEGTAEFKNALHEAQCRALRASSP